MSRKYWYYPNTALHYWCDIDKCRHIHIIDVSPGCQDLTGVCPVSIRLVTRDCQLALTLELPWDRCLVHYCLLILHFLKRLLLPLHITPWGSPLIVTKMVTMVPFSQLLPSRGSMSKLCSTESSLNTLLTGKCRKYQSFGKVTFQHQPQTNHNGPVYPRDLLRLSKLQNLCNARPQAVTAIQNPTSILIQV